VVVVKVADNVAELHKAVDKPVVADLVVEGDNVRICRYANVRICGFSTL